MTPLPRSHDGVRRALFGAAGLSLALTGLVAGVHVACAHSDPHGASAEQCPICRHLDGNPSDLAAGWTACPATLLDQAPAADVPVIVLLAGPVSHGRSPPALSARA